MDDSLKALAHIFRHMVDSGDPECETENEKKIIELKYLNNYTNDEISNIMNMAEKDVDKTEEAALKRIKKN